MHATIPAAALPAIGDPLEGGFYAGKIDSNSKVFAAIIAPKSDGDTDGDIEGQWHPDYKDVPGARSRSHCMDNTQAMAEAGSPIAKWALGLDIGGRKDWSLPARDVLYLLEQNFNPNTTTIEAFKAGGAEAFLSDWYWSSTQYSSGDAWYQLVDHGTQDTGNKLNTLRARAVSMIQVTP